MSTKTKKAIVWKLEDTPFWMRERLDALTAGGEAVELCFETDMTIDGEYEPEALVVTQQRVLVFARGREEPLREVQLPLVALSKVKWLMGSGFLLVTTWSENIEMLRFSSSLSTEVEDFKEELDGFLMARLAWECPDEHEEHVEHRDDEESTAEANEVARRCPKCGQLLPQDRDICRACLSSKAVVARMLSYLGPYKPLVALGMALTCLMAGIQATLPALSGTLIDDAIGGANVGLLKMLAMILAGLLFTRAITMGVHRLVMTRLAQNVILDLRGQVYSHLQRLSMDYHDRQSTGRLISRVVSDTAQLQQFAVGQVQQFVVDILFLVIILVWMLTCSVRLTVMLWFPLPLFFLLGGHDPGH